MADREKKGNAFTNNPIVKAIGTQKIVVVLVIIFLAIMFSVGSPAFRQYSTLVSIFDYSYYISFMAIGVTFCLITGGVDLSIGTGMICYALFGGHLITKVGMPVVVGMLAAIALGVLIGLLNALLVAVMDLPPFIATLGSMMLSKGLGSIFTKAQSVTWPQSSQAEGWFRNIFKINQNGVLIPTGFILLIIVAVIASIVLNKTRPGRYIVALGSTSEATRLSGVNIAKWRTLAYIISGTLAGLAGLAYASIYSTILPGGGGGFELDAIAGVVIGGTSMSGGYGTISGTLIGVFIMSVLKTGLPFVGLQSNWQQAVTGVVLVFAVFMDVMNRQKKKKA